MSQALRGRLPAGRTPAPRNFAIAPKPLRETSCERAREIYQGGFTLAGTRVETGAHSPFLIHDAPLHWRRAAASFEWLADLAATKSELARVQARCLIADWIDADTKRRGPGWELAVISQRLISWLSHAPFYLTNVSDEFHAKLMTSTGRQVRHLSNAVPQCMDTWPGLYGAIALNYAVVCTDGLEKHFTRAADALSRTLEQQVLPDGGHISRNPAHVVDHLEVLLPLKNCFIEKEVEAPDGLVSAIDRLFPLLRLFLHGDMGLAFFNGASETRRRLIAAILAEDAGRAKPLSCARQSGYARLAQGKTVIVADIGKPRSARSSDTGHAGALAFEMSHGTQRIIVNCGHSALGPDEWRAATRATTAHSTLAIADRSSTRVFDAPVVHKLFGGPLAFGPGTVSSDVRLADAGELLSAEHDGFVRAYGFSHCREVYLASTGTDIRGEDRLVPTDTGNRPTSHPFSIHFHLHPSIKATASKDNNSVLLMAPDKTGWRFSARGALIRLDESVHFVDRDVPHSTLQIVLFAETSRTLKVQWALKKIEKTAARSRHETQKTSRLPLRGGRMN